MDGLKHSEYPVVGTSTAAASRKKQKKQKQKQKKKQIGGVPHCNTTNPRLAGVWATAMNQTPKMVSKPVPVGALLLQLPTEMESEGVASSAAAEDSTTTAPAAPQLLVDIDLLLQPELQAKTDFPAWFAAAKILVLLQPSSAAAERVFSLLEAMFGKKGCRGSSKADLKSTSLQLRSHGRK